ncbi:slipin family protein [Persicimonas caeni]|uniref:Slipin family protein n=1 Tax=Persicimonas caeni TaxID=2292766 RepID=A0A4Y6PRX1_PERCE|nr:SPFH domain-containing protein [Persicimonas caeni]QDG51082.1 slipin family protein [Persicimonas caeni]QED32303.1 slipin family protein [Persicimonas caeni]
MLSQILPWVTVVNEYERVAVFRLGRIVGYRGPGVVWRLPFIERFQKVDSRIVTVDVEPQECISRDNVPVTVNAVVYYRVEHPDKAIVNVKNYHRATIEIAQTSLRSTIGRRTLDELLSEVVEVADDLKRVIDVATDEWGVKVSRTEIKDIRVPDEMRKAMAKEAEAERERRAMIIRAQGEQEAADRLVQAAKLLDQTPTGFKMRYLQTLLQVAEEGNTIVFAPGDMGAANAAVAAADLHKSNKRVSGPPEHPKV